jgi:MoaA/NifB/PqqE/SkfB family radical SAM enzyme
MLWYLIGMSIVRREYCDKSDENCNQKCKLCYNKKQTKTKLFTREGLRRSFNRYLIYLKIDIK